MIYELNTIPSADDYPALQAGINQAIAAGYLEIHISGGPYKCSRGLLFCDPAGNFLNGIHFYGDGGCDAPYTFNITDPSAYAVNFVRAKGCICEKIRVSGVNTGLLNYTQQQILSNDASTFLTNGSVDDPVIPHAGFVIDGIGYPELKSYKQTSSGGSTDVIFRNCVARYFTVDYALNPGGMLENGEAIKIVDCWGDYAKVVISTGGSQQRTVLVENFKCWGIVETVFDSSRYGKTGCPPEVTGVNLAGGIRYLCRLNNWISKGLIIRNAHMESLWSLGGNFENWVNQLAISDSFEARPTDTCFKYSPDTGTPECICSRCGAKIQAGEMPIRLTTTNKKGKVDKNSMEYRYCEECMTGKKFFPCDHDITFGSRCETQCEDCRLNPPEL